MITTDLEPLFYSGLRFLCYGKDEIFLSLQGVRRGKRSTTASIAKFNNPDKELDEFTRQVVDMAAEREDGYNRNVERFREEEYPMLKGWSGIVSQKIETN